MAETPLPLPAYAELFCLSNFTFLHGASHAEELVARAVKLDYSALAVTDECTLAGVVRAHAEAGKTKLPLIIGSHFHLTHADGSAAWSLLALAQNREGYGNLSELITLARSRSVKGEYRLMPQDFTTPPPALSHLRGLPDCLLILLPDYPAAASVLDVQAGWMRHHFGDRAWIGLTQLYRACDDRHRGVIDAAATAHGLPVVALGQVCMHVRSRKPLQDAMTAIRLRKSVAQCGYALAANAEQHLRSRLRLANLFAPAALAQTVAIARRCTFSLNDLRYEYPDELVPHNMTPAGYLRQETMRGARRRYPQGIPEQVVTQIGVELGLINDMAFEAYFLTVYDIVLFARSRNILCQGRGSAANSAVCYCLGITEIDPSRSILLFERFISKERNEPPDIDVDFEHQRREEVIQHIYRKYGRRRAALTAAVHTYRPRGALRDIGKALGVDTAVIDLVAKAQHWFDSKHALLERFTECGLDPDAELTRQWATLTSQLLGFPRHLSQHSGGFVIARGQLSRMVPIQNAAMPDRTVIEWDKDDLESLKLLKVDVLALGMLSALRRTLELVAGLRGKPFALHDIPHKDHATFEMIRKADTIGVFQIESRAQMSMLPRLRPENFYDLVIEVAIVRPGPIQGGMVHPYLKRRQGLEPVIYPDDKHRSGAFEKALERTLGVPIFQEQVMQVAIVAAGFTPGEADGLRRAMAAWKRKGGLEKYEEKIIAGMLDKGYEKEFAIAIFKQIQGFGDYGFPESHAASFALLAYASSWLKCHEPEAFLCAMLNSQPMGFYSPSQLIQDARRHDVVVLPLDVMHSDWEATLVTDAGHPQRRPQVRLGLNLLRGMRIEAAQQLMQARCERPFSDLADLAQRARLERRDLEALAAGNAMRSLAGHRHQAWWHAAAAAPDKDLLRSATVHEDPALLSEPSEADDIVGDYRATGLSLQRHPLALLRPLLLKQRFLPAAMLETFQDRQFARGCGIVTGRQRPGTAKGVVFMSIEDETGYVNVIVWPDLLEKQRHEVLHASLLGVYGIWQSHSGVCHLIAKRLVDLSHLLGKLETSSRDFH